MDLALIGNGSYQAIVNSRARLRWLCWPRFDSSPVFAHLIDEERGGYLDVRPQAGSFKSSQRYLPETAIIETSFESRVSSFTVTDVAPRFVRRRGEDMHRPRELLRILRPTQGESLVSIHCDLTWDYARRVLEGQGPIGPEGRRYETPEGIVLLRASRPIELDRPLTLAEDQELALSLQWLAPGESPEGEGLDLYERALEEERRTVDQWRDYVHRLDLPKLYRDEVVRSAITLKLHHYEDTGAITAAATTSLPEHIGCGRNWDYRFCWPRDSYFTVDALAQLGEFETSESFADFMDETMPEELPLQPLYGIGGEREVDEEVLSHLKGYQGNGPVRIGNQAYEQDQHDIYGELIAALEPLFRRPGVHGRAHRDLAMRLLREAKTHMRSVDAGLWEKRNEPQLHTYSLLMHWLAGTLAEKIGDLDDDAEMVELGAVVASEACQIIEQECWNEELGFYADAAGGDMADASLFLMVCLGYLDPEGTRAELHVAQLARKLQASPHPHLFYRYRHDDGLGETLSCFTVCSLWYAEALATMGEKNRARRVLETILGHANHVGLLSEDIDPVDGSLWGNFPQTYSHVGIIRVVLALE